MAFSKVVGAKEPKSVKLGLINSAWAQAGKDTAYGIRMTRELGFDTIDIFADPLDIDVRERRLINASATGPACRS